MSLDESIGSIQRHGSIGANVDYDTVSIPGAIIERQRQLSKTRGSQYDEKLSNLVGSNTTDTVYLIHYQTAQSNWRKWLVGPYCFLYVAAYITSYYTFIQYTYAKVQKDLNIDQLNSSGSCEIVNTSSIAYMNQVTVQENSSQWSMYFSLAVGVPAIFANVILGSWTDKFGRKFLFILPCIGTLIRIVVTVVGIYTDFDFAYYFTGFVIEGITGQLFTMLLVCFTYVADVTPKTGKQRPFGITLIEMTMGLGVTVFSFSTGYFIETYGFFYPMLSSGCMMIAGLLVACFIPESFPPEKRNPNESTLAKIRTSFELFFGSINRGRRWMYNVLIVTFLITMFTVFGRSSVEPLYQLDQPFCWSPEKLGYYGALRSSAQQMMGMGMIKLFQMVFSDVSIAMLGCVSFVVGYAMEGLATTNAVMYLVPIVGSCGLLTVPMCRSILSKLTRPDQQGAIFAAIAAVESSVNLGGSVLGNEIYSHTLTFYKGFVFFVFSGCSVICFLLMWFYKIRSQRAVPLEIR